MFGETKRVMRCSYESVFYCVVIVYLPRAGVVRGLLAPTLLWSLILIFDVECETNDRKSSSA